MRQSAVFVVSAPDCLLSSHDETSNTNQNLQYKHYWWQYLASPPLPANELQSNHSSKSLDRKLANLEASSATGCMGDKIGAKWTAETHSYQTNQWNSHVSLLCSGAYHLATFPSLSTATIVSWTCQNDFTHLWGSQKLCFEQLIWADK